MTEYTFFTEKADRWRKDMASLWGNLNICPHLYWLELPCHSQAELFFISSLKVWGSVQKPHHNIAYLLVWVRITMKDRQYGISLVWMNPNQVRAATTEEAVKRLTACTSSGTNWPYSLVQLYKGPHHAPLPKDKHLGILPWGKVEETPCGEICQLQVCQLFTTGPQVIYPISLNGHDEPIITTLPKLLDSGISLIASEHVYLEIDIPSLPMEEPNQMIPPLSEASTILLTSPHKSPPNQKAVWPKRSVTSYLKQCWKHPAVSLNTHPQGGQPQQWSSWLHPGSQRVHSR